VPDCLDWDSAAARFKTFLAEGREQGLVRETLEDLSVLRKLHAQAGPRIDALAWRLRDMVHDQE
jgi:hypothetical protein